MKPGYEIEQYGMSSFIKIYVKNYININKVSMVQWHKEEWDFAEPNLVAIFKIKWKTHA